MITGERMAAVDENAAALGVPRKQLMESSGGAIARVVREAAPPGSRVAIVAGRGNNGGDAFVAARFLDDYETTTLLLGRPETIGTEIARENWRVLERAGYDCRTVTDSQDLSLPDADVIVDAMLGTGISGALREPAATAARAINAADATVVSVDVPSGFDADEGDHADERVEADRVITFHDEKPGLDALSATITVSGIGIPEAAERFLGPGDLGFARPDSREGRTFVVGGGPYTGAPALAAQAALRAGAELSFVAAPEAVAGEIQGYAEDLIVQPYEGDRLTPDRAEELVETAAGYDDVVVLGPGLGNASETVEGARLFLESYDGPIVVDADALEIVPEVDARGTLLCTPNKGELAAMGGPEVSSTRESLAEIESFADELGHVLVVKGEDDVVTDGERTRVARVGVPGMAVGGTGDLLAGLSAGLLEHAPAFEAAGAAAYVNGRAGELAASEAGHEEGLGIYASDLLAVIPRVLWGEAGRVNADG